MYHILPSEVAARATTYDIMVMDMMTAWEQYQQRRASGESYTPEIPTDTLVSMLEQHKAKKNVR